MPLSGILILSSNAKKQNVRTESTKYFGLLFAPCMCVIYSISFILVELETEITDAETQKESLKIALDDKKGPLEIGLRRHKLRQIRPSRELIHDEVEKALITEVMSIEAATASMDAKLSTVEKELLRLKQHAHAISENIRDKETAALVDEKCLNIEKDVSDTESIISVFGGPPRVSCYSYCCRIPNASLYVYMYICMCCINCQTSMWFV